MTVTEISWSTVLANTGAFLACAAILGAFFRRYAKLEGAKAIGDSIALFEKEKLSPLIEGIRAELKDVANLSNRVGSLQIQVETLNKNTGDLTHTVAKNAQQSRDDITGLGNRLESSAVERDRMLVELIKASK